MARTILIPTDLSVASLNTLKHALDQSTAAPLNVVLLFPYIPPTGITELLFHSPTKALRALRSAEFDEALEVLRNRHEHKVADVRVELFQGRTSRAFEDFARQQGVEEIHLPEPHLRLEHPQGFDVLPALMASALPKHVHNWQPSSARLQEDRLQVLFQR